MTAISERERIVLLEEQQRVNIADIKALRAENAALHVSIDRLMLAWNGGALLGKILVILGGASVGASTIYLAVAALFGWHK